MSTEHGLTADEYHLDVVPEDNLIHIIPEYLGQNIWLPLVSYTRLIKCQYYCVFI
jgi:hypothetical protein